MAETGNAELIHPNVVRQAQSVATLKTALLSDGFTAAELSSATKNDLVYMDGINATRKGVSDRQDVNYPFHNVTTVATAGIPGTLSPTGAVRPPTRAAMNAAATAVTASPLTAWTTGQYVKIEGDVHVFWDGDSWEAGEAS